MSSWREMLEMQMSTLQKQEISFLSKSPVLFVRWSWFPKINIIVLPISRHIVIKEDQHHHHPRNHPNHHRHRHHHYPPDLHCHIVIKEAQQSAPPDVTLSVSVILIKFNEMWLIQLPWVFLADSHYLSTDILVKSGQLECNLKTKNFQIKLNCCSWADVYRHT